MSRFAVILAAAGRSTRFGDARRKKPFVDLKGRPIWLRALDPFLNREDVAQILVCVSPDDLEWFKEKFRPNLAFMEVEVVPGGRERSDTIAKGLERVRDEIDFVAVHDAARPLLTPEWVDELFEAAEKYEAVIPGVPVAATLKRVEKQTITATVDRSEMYLAQTPQVFRRELLLEAYAKRGNEPSTDDAQLVERLGRPVRVVEGSPLNFKITTQADLRLAEAALAALPKPNPARRLHPFADEEPRELF